MTESRVHIWLDSVLGEQLRRLLRQAPVPGDAATVGQGCLR